LPRKAKKPEKPFVLKHWQPITAVIAVVTLISAVGVIAYDQYTQNQISVAAESSLDRAESRIQEISKLVDELEETIRDADQIAYEASGRTLDEQARKDLVAELEVSAQVWVDQKTKLLKMQGGVEQLLKLRGPDGRWSPDAMGIAKLIDEVVDSDWTPITDKISSILAKSSTTQAAQGQWLREQDRIAAENAAQKAAEKAAADNVARQSTEPTGIAIPAAQPTGEPCTIKPIAESPNKQTIASYILGLASNAEVTWQCGICAPGTICGQAWLPNLSLMYPGYVGLPQSARDARVVIVLDENHIDLYLSPVGLSILVHEAAHARQHVTYGTEIRRVNEAVTGRTGDIAIEWMADCATIVKYGQSTGAYTSQCSPSELEEAAKIW
jgi:hypothetical protein